MQFSPIIIVAFPRGKHDIFAKLDYIEELIMATKQEVAERQARFDTLEAGLSNLGGKITTEAVEVVAVINELKIEISKLNDQVAQPADLSALLGRIDGFVAKVNSYGNQVANFAEAPATPGTTPDSSLTLEPGKA